MAGLQEAQAAMAKWRAEGKDSEGSGGMLSYWPRTGDVVQFHFITSGKDGDPYFEVYQAHEIPAATPGAFSTLKPCPVVSGLDLNANCMGCNAGHKLKKRFRVWLYVANIYRTKLREGEQLPLVQLQGRQFYQQTVDGPMVWDSSAWRDGALSDIMALFDALNGDLRATGCVLQVTGEGFDRRFKLWAPPGQMTPLPAEVYQSIQPQIKPIKDMLKAELTPVVAAPTGLPAIEWNTPPVAPPASFGSALPPAVAPNVSSEMAPALPALDIPEPQVRPLGGGKSLF